MNVVLRNNKGNGKPMEVIIRKHYFPFGKYKGQKITSVIDSDLQYILWFLENMEVSLPEYIFSYLIQRIRRGKPKYTLIKKYVKGPHQYNLKK